MRSAFSRQIQNARAAVRSVAEYIAIAPILGVGITLGTTIAGLALKFVKGPRT